MARDLILTVDKDPPLLCRINTEGEKSYFLYDPQSERASATWKSPQSPRKQKFRQDRSRGGSHTRGVLRYPGHCASRIYS
ncbi:hypothetical protein TNCV_4223071 [Trichonephila clavipes]|nr:hypothetical protein TNCV_4223071 [Trichonephila clavipes]